MVEMDAIVTHIACLEVRVVAEVPQDAGGAVHLVAPAEAHGVIDLRRDVRGRGESATHHPLPHTEIEELILRTQQRAASEA